MAVIEQRYLGQRGGDWSVGGGRRYTLIVQMVTDTIIGPRTAIQALLIKLGDTYAYPIGDAEPIEWDEGSYVQSIRAEDVAEDGLQWKITVEYGPYDAATQGGAGNEDGVLNPFNQPPAVEWSNNKYQVAALKDVVTGNPILNTVGDPFDPPLEREESRPTLVVRRNETTFDPLLVGQYKDHVNSDEFLGFQPNEVRCTDITATREYANDWGYFYTVTYQFEISPIWYEPGEDEEDEFKVAGGWTRRVLNAGFRQKKDGKVVQVLLEDGSPVSSPVALNEDGEYDPEANPHYLDFDIYPTVAFSGLDIPSDLLTKVSTPGGGGS